MATALTEASVVAGALLALRRRGAHGMLAEKPLVWAGAALCFAAGWSASGALRALLLRA